jgi:hypothetical protein
MLTRIQLSRALGSAPRYVRLASSISLDNKGQVVVPNDPIIPFIEGDGTGPDIWRSSVRVFDAAVEKVRTVDSIFGFNTAERARASLA